MSVRRGKVLGDVRHDVLATSLSVLVLALGTASFVVFTASGAMVRSDFHDQYLAADQPQVIVGAAGTIDEAVARDVAAIPGVEVVELVALLNARIRTADGRWQPFELTAVEDLASWRLGRSEVVLGPARPTAGEILVDRSAIDALGLAVGDETELQLADGRVVAIRVAGLSRQPGRAAWFEPPAFGVTTIGALSQVGALEGATALAIGLTDPDRPLGFPPSDPLLQAVAAVLRAAGTELRDVRVLPAAGETSLDESLDGIDLVLGTLGNLGLLSGAVVTASATVAALRRQRRQLGVLQAIGAAPRQLLALVVARLAAPIGAGIAVGLGGGLVGAVALSRWVGSLINVEQAMLLPPPTVILVQLAVSAGVTAVVILVATWRALATPAVANLRDDSLVGSTRGRALVRPLEGLARSMPARVGLRNALRSGAASILLVAALALGGALFLAVTSVGDGLASLTDVEPADRIGYDLLAWCMGGIAAVIVAVAALGLFARVLAGVAERRRELGVLVAVGASPVQLGGVVLHEALGVAVLGWAGALLLWPAIAVPLGVSLGETLTGRVVAPAFGLQPLGLLAMMVGATVAAALLPAIAALRVRVRDALAYE